MSHTKHLRIQKEEGGFIRENLENGGYLHFRYRVDVLESFCQ